MCQHVQGTIYHHDIVCFLWVIITKVSKALKTIFFGSGGD